MKKIIKGFIIMILLFIFKMFVYGINVPESWSPPILESFNYGRLYNVYKVPDWKLNIYKELNINYEDFMILNSIDNIECGREDGGCISPNSSDAGPFQINYIHTKTNKLSKKLIYEKKREELFKMQMLWTINRIHRFDKSRCNGYKDFYKRAQCQLIHHNGNNKGCSGKVLNNYSCFKRNYSQKGLKVIKTLEKYNIKSSYEIIKNTGFTIETKYLPFTGNIELNNELLKITQENQELKKFKNEQIYNEKKINCESKYFINKRICDIIDINILPEKQFNVLDLNINKTININTKNIKKNEVLVKSWTSYSNVNNNSIENLIEQLRLSKKMDFFMNLILETNKKREHSKKIIINNFEKSITFNKKLPKSLENLKKSYVISTGNFNKINDLSNEYIKYNSNINSQIIKLLSEQQKNNNKIMTEMFETLKEG